MSGESEAARLLRTDYKTLHLKMKHFFARAETAKLFASVRRSTALLYLACIPGISSVPRTRPHQAGRQISLPLCSGVHLSARDIQLFRQMVGRGPAARKCARRRAHPRLFPLLLMVLPAKLLVSGRIVTWSEVAGAVLACICWYFLSAYPRRTMRGLAPPSGEGG